MSFIEIYNENLKDLLVSGYDDEEDSLEIREDPIKRVHISGVQEVECKNTSEVMSLLVLGNENRTTEATDANNQSSRSHAVMMINIEYRNKDDGIDGEYNVSKLVLIDLAGSERAS